MPGLCAPPLKVSKPGDSRANLGRAGTRESCALVANSGAQRPIELHLFSDMQKTSHAGKLRRHGSCPRMYRLFVHPVGIAQPAPNWTVESVSAPGPACRSQRPEEIAGAGGHCRIWNKSGRIEELFRWSSMETPSPPARWIYRRTAGQRLSFNHARCGLRPGTIARSGSIRSRRFSGG